MEKERRYCTVPAVFGLREWFESRFGDLCQAHDEAYVEQEVNRREADKAMRDGMVERGYPITGNIIYYAFLRPIGWLYWHDIIK